MAALRPRVATTLLALSMFFTGAAGFIFECILSTVATFILGNSIEQFSVTISLMMLMMGVAGYWQSRLSDSNLIFKFLLVETSLALLGGFAPIAVYSSYALVETHFALVQYFFVLAIGFLIGLEIPLVLRINRLYVPQLKSNIATVFSTDYIGAFVGALIWVYVLLKYFPLTEISFFVAALNFAVALITFGYFAYHGEVSRRIAAVALVAVTATALAFGYIRNRDWNEALEQRFYDHPIVFSKTTKYQHLVLTGSVRPTDYRLYINGNLQFSSLDEHIYHEMLVHPAMALAGKRDRVLILGGGDGLGLREVLKYGDVREVVLADIDPDMIALARDHVVMGELNQGAFSDARVIAQAAAGVAETDLEAPVYEYSAGTGRLPELKQATSVTVYTVDADKLADSLEGPFDVILIDLPDPNSVELVKLYSREFYFKVRRLLAHDGMMTVQSTSPYHAKESFLCIRRTLESAGFETQPYHDNVPSFGDWGWILAWGAGGAQRPPSQLAIAEDRLRYLTPERLAASMSFGKGSLETAETDVNRLMQPALMRYYLSESWQQ